jgi:hypothetical protein
MKRCPQCLFLYPESDERCDFDNTPLEVVDEAEVAAATGSNRPARRKVVPLAAAVGLMLGVLVFAVYYGVSQFGRKTSAAPVTVASPAPPQPEVTPLPSASPDVSPSPSPSPSPKSSPATVSTAHTRATSDPVSTSGPGIAQRQGGKPVIMLTSGGRIDADEVWRTRDGVWYRRNGIVTLLKRGQVRSIVTR